MTQRNPELAAALRDFEEIAAALREIAAAINRYVDMNEAKKPPPTGWECHNCGPLRHGEISSMGIPGAPELTAYYCKRCQSDRPLEPPVGHPNYKPR